MKTGNQTMTPYFLLVGFSDFPHIRILLYVMFLLIYLTTLCGNLLIVLLIYCDSHLHTPMYFFISSLSLIDLGLTTTIFPKMLANFFVKRPYVTFKGCLVQLYFFFSMEGVENVVLTAMAYDRYIAICNPLRYTVIMTRDLCCQVVSGAAIFGLIVPLPHMLMTAGLSFCDSHQINHFFCDLTALLKISCTSTQTIEMLTYTFGIIVVLICFSLTLISYIYIISIILKIQSAQGRQKGFSTCASHLIVVILFYGSLTFIYLRPSSMYSMTQNKMISLMYCAAVPLFNPIIYSLTNKELRNTLKKAMQRRNLKINRRNTINIMRKVIIH